MVLTSYIYLRYFIFVNCQKLIKYYQTKKFEKWNGLELNKLYQSSMYWEQKMAINCVRNTLVLFFQHRKFHLTQKKKFSFSWYCMMEEQTHFISSIPRDGQQPLLTETGWRIYYNNWFQSSDGNSAVSWRRKTGALKKNSVRCTGIFLRLQFVANC